MPFIKSCLLACVVSVLLQATLCTTTNCCAVKESELRSITPNSACPLSESTTFGAVSTLDAKCDECPEGTCRVNFSCYCPSDFLSSDAQQELCRFSFGEKWPLSVEKEDTIYRSCVKEPSFTTTDENCCSLTEKELEERVGTSNECPKDSTSITFAVVKSLQKCDRCPFGTCRIGLSCFCPKDFLNSDRQQELCRASFTEKWDTSVGLEDRYWRSCLRPTPSESFTFDNCCEISPEQLDIRVGTSESCPMSSTSTSAVVDSLSSQCDPCPFGSCRVGSDCYCPEDFLNSENQKELCREAFGEVYPDSIGKKDTFCPENPPPSSLTPLDPKPTSSKPGTSTPSKPAETSSNPTSSSTPTSDPSSDEPTSPSSPPPQPKDPDVDEPDSGASSDNGNLSTAEIVGIVIGSITGIISALGVIYTWCRSGQKESKEPV